MSNQLASARNRRFSFFGQSLIGANDAVLLIASPSAALAPWGAPRPLRIQTRPPISPTTNVAAPKRIDSVNPSPSARPANAKAAIMLLSRTPHPAIDIGMVETNKTGGKRINTCARLTGATIAIMQHHAEIIVIK